MRELIAVAKHAVHKHDNLPFSVYSSIQEQRLLSVPVLKPLLIFVLGGVKHLGRNDEVVCQTGHFVFLSNNPTVDMRNIPVGAEYFAILIEFEYSDFSQLTKSVPNHRQHVQGKVDTILEKELFQFVEWSTFAPPELWSFRKKELLHTLFHLGYEDVAALAVPPSLSHQIYDIISSDIPGQHGVASLADKMAISESTLRRRLKVEGTSIQTIRTRVKMGYGLHLIQTTMEPIGYIAECCGYHSQSRFTTRFKRLFGITPTDLRKTRVND